MDIVFIVGNIYMCMFNVKPMSFKLVAIPIYIYIHKCISPFNSVLSPKQLKTKHKEIKLGKYELYLIPHFE
jgi:hypothetical protein